MNEVQELLKRDFIYALHDLLGMHNAEIKVEDDCGQDLKIIVTLRDSIEFDLGKFIDEENHGGNKS